MTDTAQGFGSEYSWSAQTSGPPFAPPIPPPASPGAAQGTPGYASHQGGGAAAAWLGPRSPRSRVRAAVGGVASAVVVAIVLLLAGVFKSGSGVTRIQATESAAASAQAQAGLKQPGMLSV